MPQIDLPELIHYGTKKFDCNLVSPIENCGWVKPKGGLWTSPVNSKFGWKDWCEDENFRKCDEDNSIRLRLKSETRVLIIDSESDLNKLPFYPSKVPFLKEQLIDFEELSINYDIIWLTVKGLSETKWSEPMNLYGWDCESVLIMNTDCCEEII